MGRPPPFLRQNWWPLKIGHLLHRAGTNETDSLQFENLLRSEFFRTRNNIQCSHIAGQNGA